MNMFILFVPWSSVSCSPLELGMSIYHGRVKTHRNIVYHFFLFCSTMLTFDLG